MNKLPTWATQAMQEAGVDAEGWVSHDLGGSVKRLARTRCLYVDKFGEVSIHNSSIANLATPDAFRLADRLRRALAGEPDPRVAELEAEVERLKTEVQELQEYKHIWHDPQLHHYNLLRCPVLSDAQLRHLLGDDGGIS